MVGRRPARTVDLEGWNNIKHIKTGYSQAIQLASWAIEIFYNEEQVYGFSFEDFWSEMKEEIYFRLSKPNKDTLLHFYLNYVDGFVEHSLDETLKNLGSAEYKTYFNYVCKLIEGTGETIDINAPNYDLIIACGHCTECEECQRLNKYIDYLSEKQYEIMPRVIDSAFHLLMLNKSFLKDFHTAVGVQLREEETDLSELYPGKFSKDNKPNRVNWPSWLKKGLFYRDRGVCVSCRTDLTGVINQGDSFEIDHIVPLSRYGTNDPSNLQIFCKICNIKKLNHASVTSVYDVPLWD